MLNSPPPPPAPGMDGNPNNPANWRITIFPTEGEDRFVRREPDPAGNIISVVYTYDWKTRVWKRDGVDMEGQGIPIPASHDVMLAQASSISMSSQGEERILVEWISVTYPTPQRANLLVEASAGAAAGSNGSGSASNGMVDPVVEGDGGILPRGWISTGKHIRYVPIDPSTRVGHLDVPKTANASDPSSPPGGVWANARGLLAVIDPREVGIEKIFGTWPNSIGSTQPSSISYVFSQDYWEWYSSYIQPRTKTWQLADVVPAKRTYGADKTDHAEWHIGLTTGYKELLSPGIPGPLLSSDYTVGEYIGHVVNPRNGDPYRWQIGRNPVDGAPGGPYEPTYAGVFDDDYLVALVKGTAYIPAIQYKNVDGPSLFKVEHDAWRTDSTTLDWTWTEDGAKGKSVRIISTHPNREREGQDTGERWIDCRVGAGYEGVLESAADAPGWPNIQYYVDPGVEICSVSQISKEAEMVGTAFSTVGSIGAVVVAAGALTSSEWVIAFAAARAIGAAIGFVSGAGDPLQCLQSKYLDKQTDSIMIEGIQDLDNDGINDVGDGELIEYNDPGRLTAIKSKIQNSGILQVLYWKPKRRRIELVKFELWNKWGLQGFEGQETAPNSIEVPSSGFYHITFRRQLPA